MSAREDVRAIYHGIVERVNAGLAQFEQLEEGRVVPGELTIDRGEVTPTLKVKRRVVEETCRDVIDGLYALSDYLSTVFGVRRPRRIARG